MHKDNYMRLPLLSASALFLACHFLPVSSLAADAVPVERGEIENNQNGKSKKSFLSMKGDAPAGTVKQRAVAFPKAAAGVLAGLTIGVPVKISKDIRKETRRMAGTLRGDVGNEFGLTENAIVLGGSIPFGIMSGLIMGTVRGTERAVTYGAAQPFSKESLGLKEPEQEPKEQ